MKLDVIAERYRALCEVGDQTGVIPMVELWGHSKTLTRLSEAAYVALEARHPKASILADVFHLYKGGSDPSGLLLLSPGAVPAIHINDYPQIERTKVTDGDRTMPGEGVAPLTNILKQLAAMHLRYPESTDYRRGVVDVTNSMALYLEALIDDPADERVLEEAA